MHPVVLHIRQALRQRADPARAAGMAAYMKHQQPFAGVAMPEVVKIAREAGRRITPVDFGEARQVLRGLWQGQWREERYAAIRLAELWKVCGRPEALELYEWMVRNGRWWDLVDRIASVLMGGLISAHPRLKPQVFTYIESEEMWLRRCALLCQLKFKQATDTEALARMVLTAAGEQEFFIRKAIGWALREYAKTDAAFVRGFVREHEVALSRLSRGEALKNL